MTAADLMSLLAARHTGDVFVPECKNGPTSAGSGRHRRLDGWALLRTWSPITCIGYEVKVSRSDWLNDDKFTDYLPLCHKLFLVAPKGVVEPAELPLSVGLLEPIGTGTGMRLVTRRKVVRREISLPSDLLVYVLMSRARIVAPNTYEKTREQRAEVFRHWATTEADYQALGQLVSSKFHRQLREAFDRAHAAERKAEGLQTAADLLADMGLTAGADRWQLRNRIERALGATHAKETLAALSRARNEIDALSARIEAAQAIHAPLATEAMSS